jgi:hypothetical protein
VLRGGQTAVRKAAVTRQRRKARELAHGIGRKKIKHHSDCENSAGARSGQHQFKLDSSSTKNQKEKDYEIEITLLEIDRRRALLPGAVGSAWRLGAGQGVKSAIVFADAPG